MRAAICRGIGDISVEEIDEPTPLAGEIKIKIAAVGVCHTDLSILTGHLPSPRPIVLGHEGAGVVTEIGPGVREFAVGDPEAFRRRCMEGPERALEHVPELLPARTRDAEGLRGLAALDQLGAGP